MAQATERWAGDVLVIGAGMAGALLAARLQPHCSVTLTDQGGFGAGQSNHSHGYLHRGYIYIAGASGLAKDLQRGASRWQALLDDAGCDPVSRCSTVAFSDPVAARSGRATWRSSDLRVESCQPADGLDPSVLKASYRTAEQAYDFSSMFVALRDRLEPSVQLRAQVRRLRVRDGHVEAVEARTSDGEPLILRSHLYVLAAGADNAQLLRRATRYRGRAISRMSYMAIAAGRDLPPLSLILPGNSHYGLFVVSRPLPDGGNAWLISNFISLGFDDHRPEARKLWLRSLLRSLGAVAPALRDPSLRWGLYDAPKGELRDTPGVMAGHSYETFGLSNLFALAPTKLTLAPLLAEEVEPICLGRLRGLTPTDADVSTERLPVLPERWLAERLLTLDDLLERVGCSDAGQALWRPGPGISTAA